MQLSPTANSDFWVNLWQETRCNSPIKKRRQHTERDMIDGWNKRAKEFAQFAKNDRGQKRQQGVLDFLTRESALQKDFEVLDIGSGPGNYTIPMARIVSRVTALEPASEMIKILRERAGEEHLGNISVMQRTWQEVDVEKEGLTEKFDLVFASMTPGVQDMKTLEKMIKASRGYCYLSGFSGHRWGKAYQDLWQQFFHEEIGDNPGDIIYPFGALYSLGYRPNLRFVAHRRIHEQPLEEAIESILKFFANYLEITAETRKTIEDYVGKHNENGIFRQEVKGCSGMMVWKVKEVA